MMRIDYSTMNDEQFRYKDREKKHFTNSINENFHLYVIYNNYYHQKK